MSRAAIRAAIIAGEQIDHNNDDFTPFLRVNGRNLRLEDAAGQVTPQGRLYQEVCRALGINPNITAWRAGTHPQGRNTIGYLLNGTTRILRFWDAANNRLAQTRDGDSYYNQFRD